MRLILDTVGKVHWPADPQGRPIYPEGYEDLAKKLNGTPNICATSSSKLSLLFRSGL
jgi:hypothetical protein